MTLCHSLPGEVRNTYFIKEPSSELQERHDAVSLSSRPGKEYVSHKGAK